MQPKRCDTPIVRYPPGHGDLYRSFYESGLLQQLLDEVKHPSPLGCAEFAGFPLDTNQATKLLTRPWHAG